MVTTVLIVDDEPVLRLLLTELLQADEARDVVAVASVDDVSIALGKRAVDVALIERHLEHGSGVELARRLKNADAMSEIILMSAFPTSDSVLEAVEAGATDYLAKPFEDIQEVAVRVQNAEERVRLRREREDLNRALGESEERFRRVFAASPDAIVVYEKSSELVESVNDAVERIYGYPPGALIGQPIHMLRTFEDKPGSLHPGLRPERRDVSRDGARLDVEVTSGEFSFNGRTMVVEVVRDVSARMEAERERRKLESQLRHTQRLEAVGMLAGGIAHDFNNILAVITNYASIMVSVLEEPDELDVATLDEGAEQILQAAGSAALMTRQLLAFSRREVAQPEVHAPNETLAALEKILRRSIGERVTLVTQLSSEAGYVEMDRGHLEQVIVNLAVNARDAMPGGGQLTISTGSRDRDGSSHFRLEVRDDGVGMTPELVASIFEPFFTTKGPGQGTGLGLATVKGIIDAARGDISVSSSPGQGTSFVVELPSVPAPASTGRRPKVYGASAQPGEVVMLVEDDDAVRGAIRHMLQRAGFGVVEARDGQEALEKLSVAERVDLLLTDAVMPGMNGDVLADEVFARRPSIPVMYMTGYAAEGLRRRARGTDPPVLAKPFRQERLLDWVRNIIDKERDRSNRPSQVAR